MAELLVKEDLPVEVAGEKDLMVHVRFKRPRQLKNLKCEVRDCNYVEPNTDLNFDKPVNNVKSLTQVITLKPCNGPGKEEIAVCFRSNNEVIVKEEIPVKVT